MANNKIHICYLADASSIHTLKLVDYFNKKGYRVSVISFNPGAIEGVNIYFINLGFLSRFKLKYLLGLPKVKRLLAELKPDILHAVYLTSYGFVGSLTQFHPFIISAIGSDVTIRPRKSFILKLLVKYAIKRANLIHSQAAHLTKELISLGAKPEQVITFTYGVDLRLFKQKKENDPQNKKQRIIISTRAFEAIYNLELLIYSIPKVLKEISDVKFLLIGSGKQERKLKELARKLGVSQSVEFLGKLSNEEVLNYLSRADIYISTSLSDGQSLSLLEAMASGVFPIVTDIPSNRVWIRDNKNGFLCLTDEPNQLSKKILEALTNDNLRVKAVKRNQALVVERGSYKKNMEIMEKYYLQLISSKN